MDTQSEKDWFFDIENIVSEDLKFKAKLAIGEDAYTTLRLKNTAREIWDVTGVAGTAVVIAQSSVVASTFFAPQGLLAMLGFGVAVTPIGWVVAAGVITGGAWFGVTRYVKNASGERVTVIPKFINTPLDVLALGLFDLLAPLSLKVSEIDGTIDETERQVIRDYFVKEWGYDLHFVNQGLKFTEENLSEYSLKEVAQTLAEFKKANPDCNYKSMSKEILSFLNNVIEADGRVDEREEMAIERVEKVFDEIGKVNFKQYVADQFRSVKNKATVFECDRPYVKID